MKLRELDGIALVARTKLKLLLVTAVAVLLVACAGPEDRDDVDPSATPVAQAAASTVVPSPTQSPVAEASATASPTTAATMTPSPTPTASPTVVVPTATPEATATATSIPIALEDSLPTVDQFPVEGFALANQGTRSALDLANSYSDSSAHLERLDDWGFKEHLFKEFSREAGGPEDVAPVFVLTTVNEYGSAEQAVDVLDWLRLLNASQGQAFVDPDPEIGDAAIASSVETANGTPTAIVFVQLGPRIYAYFAEGGVPLDFVLELATENTRRISG